MRINSKGQVTIPTSIRKKLELLPGTEVTLAVDDSTVRVSKATNDDCNRGRRLVDHLRGRATVRMTTDEILGLTGMREHPAD